jgi:Zn-dependent M28 family amino/carboxypeptidase
LRRLVILRYTVFILLGLVSRNATAQQASQLFEPTAEQQRVVDRCIHEAALRGHIRFLADDLLEGRGPGSRGDALTQKYIATQFQTLGLQPAAPDGSWLQSVPLVGVKSHAPATITLRHAEQSLQLRRHDDFVMVSGKPEPTASLTDAELVFVGYGMVAPEYQWDDYKGVDLRGKVLVMMNNDPSNDPALFAGRRRLYYGRWDYKYEMAAQQGAAGAIIIHTTESAGYPYQVVQTSWSGEEFELRGKSGPRLEIRGWFAEDAARRVVAMSGHDLDALRDAANNRDFRPVPLNTTLSVELKCDVREKDTANVFGLLPGSDPTLAKEMVIIMAHHDHIGIAEEPDETGDRIYNGAVDNASGTAALLCIAHAFDELPQRPPRSILFAAVGAEEQGLLGSAYFAAHPSTHPGYLAAVVNIDGVNTIGLTHDVNVIGLGKSSMDKFVQRTARWQKRVVTPDQFPDRGYYYRSDQFSLAKIGVPGVYLHGGVQVVGKPDGWGRTRREEWVETHYHQPSDEFSDDWDLEGAVADTRLLFFTALQTAHAKALPAWTAGDEFEAARKEALRNRP